MMMPATSSSSLAVGQGVQHERRGPHGAAEGGEEQQVGLELLGGCLGVGAARHEHRLDCDGVEKGGWRARGA